MHETHRHPQWKGPRKAVTTRLRPEIKALLDERCAVSGLSIADYLSEVLQREDLDAFGYPRWLNERDTARTGELTLDLPGTAESSTTALDELPLAG